jgi:transcription initiation factor TFIIH subunit 3
VGNTDGSGSGSNRSSSSNEGSSGGEEKDAATAEASDNYVGVAALLAQRITALVTRMASAAVVTRLAESSSSAAQSRTAASLSLALLFVNRVKLRDASVAPRLLIVSATPDASAQYIPIMNAIFCAQKQRIPIDACVLHTQDSSFFQQAAHITGGVYFRTPDKTNPAALLQYFLTLFLPDVESRKLMTMPIQPVVDLRSTCICHKQAVDVGFVCPVCLAIFCTQQAKCVCGSRFVVRVAAPVQQQRQQRNESKST